MSTRGAGGPGNPLSPAARPGLGVTVVSAAFIALVVVVGFAWAKWVPYATKVVSLFDTRGWDRASVLAVGGAEPSLSGAWTFAVTYTAAIWQALVVSLFLAAAVEALLSRRWLLRVLGHGGRWRQASTGAVMSMPTMMCTCCTAPITVTLRRSGVPLPTVVAHWLGNPLLNPAVLVFLLLVAPWQWGATRLLVGLGLVVVAGALAGVRLRRCQAEQPPPTASAQGDFAPAPQLSELPGRFLRSLWRLSRVLVPEYAVVVLLVGGFSGWLSQFDRLGDNVGLLAVLVAAVIGTMLVVPTGGEIPVLLALSAVGVGSGLLGVLLITLPALSAPSMVMVARALSVRVTLLAAAAVVVGGLTAGALLSLLS